MNNICVIEDLEMIPKTVTVQERLDKGDMRVLENGAYIPATLRQGLGIISNFRTLLLKQCQLSCLWRKVGDITAVRLERARGGGRVLVDNDHHIYLMTCDLALAVPNCPSKY